MIASADLIADLRLIAMEIVRGREIAQSMPGHAAMFQRTLSPFVPHRKQVVQVLALIANPVRLHIVNCSNVAIATKTARSRKMKFRPVFGSEFQSSIAITTVAFPRTKQSTVSGTARTVTARRIVDRTTKEVVEAALKKLRLNSELIL